MRRFGRTELTRAVPLFVLPLLVVRVNAEAAPEKPVIAVFNIENRGTRLSLEGLGRLSDYMATEIAEVGTYEIVPRDQIKERLRLQKKESYRACFAESCQIELGQELAAQKSLATQVMKLGGTCAVTATLYDLRRGTAERGATAEGACSEEGVLASIKIIVGKLMHSAEPLSSSVVRTADAVVKPAEEPISCTAGDFTACSAACEKGRAVACGLLGRMYQDGQGLDADPERAVDLYRRACDGGAAQSCVALGTALRNAYGGLTRNDARAAALFKKACDAGEVSGCFPYGWMLKYGIGVRPNPERGADALELACSKGDFIGCTELALSYQTGKGRTQDSPRALELYQKACDGGYAWGCGGLGWMYKYGHGTRADYARASALLERACARGDLSGCSELAGIHQAGLGTKQDSKRAIELYQKSCEGGWSYGCGGLGWMYKYGHGVLQDYARAKAFLQDACDKGDYGACHELAWLYQNGAGVARNALHASRLLKYACKHGFEESCKASYRAVTD